MFDLNELLQNHILKSKDYVRLQSEGLTQEQALYKVWGTETGDAYIKMKQKEIIIQTNNQ